MKSFLIFKQTLSDAFTAGFIHFYSANKIYFVYLAKSPMVLASPGFWFFAYKAHALSSLSFLSRIFETRPEGRNEQVTIYKFVDYIEQNTKSIFDPDKINEVRKRLIDCRHLISECSEFIEKLNNTRDGIIAHFDLKVFKDPERKFFSDNTISDVHIEKLYKLAELVIATFSFLHDGVELSLRKNVEIMIDSDFKLLGFEAGPGGPGPEK